MLDAQQIGTSHDCAWPGCPREARDAGGYCDIGHVGEPPSRTERGSVSPGSYAHLLDDDEPTVSLPSDIDDHVSEEPAVPPAAWTRETIITAIQAYAAEHGRPPSQPDFRAKNGLPSSSLVYRLFGGQRGALEAAGFEPLGNDRSRSAHKASPPPRRGQQRRTTPEPAAVAAPSAPEERTPGEPPTLVQLAQAVEDATDLFLQASLQRHAALTALQAACDAARDA